MRPASPSAQFALATAAVSAVAWVATYAGRWPALVRLEYPIFQRLCVFSDDWAAVLEVVTVIMVWASPRLRSTGARLAIVLGRQPGIAALTSFIVLAFGARFAYWAHPFSMDEYAQVAQAHAFALGRLTWHLPAELLDRLIPTQFRMMFFAVDDSTGTVAQRYWPGFALLLTPFAWAGVPWLLNPALGAFTVLALHRVTEKITLSKDAAGWAVLLTLASPVFAINSISFYSMPALLALNLLFAWLLLDGRVSRALLAGLVGGLALILHNPLPHAAFAVPWAGYLIVQRRWRGLAAVGLGYIPLAVPGFLWPLLTDSLAHADASVIAPTGVVNPWLVLQHKFLSMLTMPDPQLVDAHLEETWKIWIWSSPGLLILFLAGLRFIHGSLLVFALSFALTYLGYWFVPFDQGHGWGYRYVYPVWAALPLIAAAFLTSRPERADAEKWRAWAGGFALLSLVLANGYWFAEVHSIIGEHLAQRIPTPDDGRWIVFIRPKKGLYTWDLIQNFAADPHEMVMISLGAASDTNLMSSRFPGAVRTVSDARGSLWRLP